MSGNAAIISSFSAYKKQGLLTEAEFCSVTQYLLGENTPPEWIKQLAEACSMFKNQQLDYDDFAAIKNSLLANVRHKASGVGSRARQVVIHRTQSQGDCVENIRNAEAGEVVRNCTIAAALIGLLPLPVADAPFLIITQFIMLKKLCAKYDRTPGAALLLIIASALLGPIAFGAFAKLIPVAGSIIGATVAGGFTWYIGTKVRGMLDKGLDFNWENFKSTPVSK